MKPYVTIELDKLRTLKYGFNELCKLEDLFGKKITELGNMQWGAKEIRILLWIGLMHEDKTLTLEKVGELIDMAGDITKVIEKVAEALQLSFGGQKNAVATETQ